MEIREDGYYIVRVTTIERAPKTEKDGAKIQTDIYQLETESGIKVIEDKWKILYQSQVVDYTNTR